MKTTPFFMFLILLCAGCSVKENRDLCPSRLVLDFSEVDTTVIRNMGLSITSGDGVVFTDELTSEDLREEYSVDVPKGELLLNLWTGDAGLMASDGLRIPLGEACPPVYFHNTYLQIEEASYHETIFLKKNHCRITFNFTSDDMDLSNVKIVGNIDGYLPDGSPSPGDFLYNLQLKENRAQVILPRQSDASLALDFEDGTGIIKRFNLGECIRQAGYDWTAENLQDLTIDIDIAFTTLRISVMGWENIIEFEK